MTEINQDNRNKVSEEAAFPAKKPWSAPVMQQISTEATQIGKTKMWPIEFNSSYGTMVS